MAESVNGEKWFAFSCVDRLSELSKKLIECRLFLSHDRTLIEIIPIFFTRLSIKIIRDDCLKSEVI